MVLSKVTKGKIQDFIRIIKIVLNVRVSPYSGCHSDLLEITINKNNRM